MFKDLLSAIETDLNKLAQKQDERPQDVQLALRRDKLKELAMEYINLQNRYKEIAGLNSVY